MQQIIGTLLFYAKAIYLKLLVILGTISTAQTSGTIEMDKAVYKLLNYCSKHTDATLQYKASGMILKSHSDVSYLSESQAKSRAGGYFYLGYEINDTRRHNGAIMVISNFIRNVMLLAAKAKSGALFYNAT